MSSLIESMQSMFWVIVPIIFAVYVVFIILNFFVIFSFLQRREIHVAREQASEHYLRSLLFCLGGIFTALEISRITQFPKFGLKFWVAENPRFNKYWYNKYEHAISKHRNIISSEQGKCQSIW